MFCISITFIFMQKFLCFFMFLLLFYAPINFHNAVELNFKIKVSISSWEYCIEKGFMGNRENILKCSQNKLALSDMEFCKKVCNVGLNGKRKTNPQWKLMTFYESVCGTIALSNLSRQTLNSIQLFVQIIPKFYDWINNSLKCSKYRVFNKAD